MGQVPEQGEIYDTKTPKWVIAQAQRVPLLRDQLEQGLNGRKTILDPGQSDLKPTLSRFSPDQWIVYVGAGSGHLSQGVQEAARARVLEVDIDNLHTPATRNPRFVVANGRELPIPDNSVDAVCLLYLLHLTERPQELIAEAMRVLKPGGEIMVIENTLSKPPKYPWSLRLVRLMNLVLNTQRVWSPEENYHTIDEWKQMLVEAGAYPTVQTKTWHWNLLDLVNQGNIWRRLGLGQFEDTRLLATKR